MTMPPPPGQGGFPPGYGQQPNPGYSSNPAYPGGYSAGPGGPPPGGYPGGPQYPSGPPGGGPQYPGNYGGGYGPGGPTGPGGFPGPPGPPNGGGRGPLMFAVIGGLVVVGGVIIALVFLLGGGDDKKNNADSTGSPTPTSTGTSTKSPTATPTTGTPTPTRTTARPTTAPPSPTSTDGRQTVDNTPLSEGDCINFNEITGRITKVSCTTPHDKQVFKNFNATGTSFPTTSEIEDQIEAACYPAYQSILSKESASSSSLTIYYRQPAQDSWTLGNRQVNCMVQYTDGTKLTKKLG